MGEEPGGRWWSRSPSPGEKRPPPSGDNETKMRRAAYGESGLQVLSEFECLLPWSPRCSCCLLGLWADALPSVQVQVAFLAIILVDRFLVFSVMSSLLFLVHKLGHILAAEHPFISAAPDTRGGLGRRSSRAKAQKTGRTLLLPIRIWH